MNTKNRNHGKNYIAQAMCLSPILVWIANGFYSSHLTSSIVFFYLHDIGSFVILPLVCLFYIHNRLGLSSASYGFDLNRTKKKLFYAHIQYDYVSSIILLIILSFSLGAIGNFFKLYGDDPYYSLFASMSYEQKVLNAIYMSSTAALFEEIFCRGYLFYIISEIAEEKYLKILYITISSILFSIMHFENGYYALIDNLIFGIALSMLYLRHKDILLLIFIHFFLDLTSLWPA